MDCLICDGPMAHYFTKAFGDYGIDNADYHRCGNCGFTASKTHFQMSEGEWAKLNDDFHAASHFRTDNPYNRNQRYFQQALMLSLMASHDLFQAGPWLDWGCGRGEVSRLLDQYFGRTLHTYDKFFEPEHNPINITDLEARRFSLVVNTAVFEHVRDRATLDEIESYVAPSGCLAVHTLVPETVPRDPAWMYLLPVHCAFHTNKSMTILMEQWGYTCSVYNPQSKLWVLFRSPEQGVREKVDRLNASLGWEYLHFKSGFMDFWK